MRRALAWAVVAWAACTALRLSDGWVLAVTLIAAIVGAIGG